MNKKQKTRKPRGVPASCSHGYSKAGKKQTLKTDEFAGIGSAIDKGYITFCRKKKNALGKKCNRNHLLPVGYTFGNGKTNVRDSVPLRIKSR